MFRPALCFLTFLMIFNLSCSSENIESGKSGVVNVTVSILPQKFIVERIGKEKVKVNVMVPPATSPEIYEPGPVKMAELKDSAIYFLIGMPFEKNAFEKMKSEFSNVRFTQMQKNIVFRKIEGGHDHKEESGFHEETYDPHIWLDPLYLIVISDNTVSELIKADPANREFYIKNLLELKKELQLLYDELLDVFKGSERKSFVIYHPAWGYFADRFGLKQIPVEIEGKEPSVAEMAKLSEFIKENKVKTIFLQAQSSETVINSLASEKGIQIKMIDPLKENVVENIRESALLIKEGLVFAKHN